MPVRHIRPITISKVSGSEIRREEADLLAAEEPLEIRLSYGKGLARKQKSISVTMRTPGNDFELALGFLFTEGLIQSPSEVKEIRYCTEVKDPAEEENVVLVYLSEGVEIDEKKLERHFYTNSSCGVCGKSSIDSVYHQGCQILPTDSVGITPELIAQLADKSREEQVLFRHTGGIHAAVIFDSSGNILLQREDVGRHNAVDKVVGALFLEDKVPATENILWVSGRAGFELVQKAVAAGITVMVAVGAPSSLAVELARNFNLTLVGFARGDRFNIYSGEHRIGTQS